MDRSYQDFSNCDLRATDLSHCTFYHANFLNADLWSCDFRESDLTNARNLSQSQLAGTDLTDAKLPQAVATFESLDSLKGLSESSSKLFATLLVSVVFTILTSANIRDAHVLTNTGYIKLPVINIDVPVFWFYFLTPMILCAMFVYFQISLQRLWEAMATLPAIFPNGRRLDEKTPAWLMNDIPRQHIPRLRATAPAASRIQWLLCVLLAYCITPLTILFLWTRSLRFESWLLIGAYSTLFGLSVATAAGFSALMDRTLAGKASEPQRIVQSYMRMLGKSKGLVAGVTAAACLAVVSYFATQYDVINPSVIVGILHFCGIQTEPNVDNEEISSKPTTWTGLSNNIGIEMALTHGTRFTSMSMCRLHAHNAFFAKSTFYCTDLTGAWFYNSDLRSCILDQVTGVSVIFNKCNFSDPVDGDSYTRSNADLQTYHAATMEGCTLPFLQVKVTQMCALHANLCDLHGADFTEAHLTGAVFTNCILVGAKFEFAHLQHANFISISAARSQQDRIDFHAADCSRVYFSNSYLSGGNFVGATLDDAVFEDVDVSEVDFSRASMARTDLSQTTGLKVEQLRNVKSLSAAKVPERLRDELAPLLSK